MKKATVGFAMCGSFCTFKSVIGELPELCRAYDIIPIMSQTAYETDTRFGNAEEFRNALEKITGHKIIHTLTGAEPIGPKKMLDMLIIAPCTGNTLAKIANGITDTSVTLAAKAHLRNQRPLLLAVSTNDALSVGAQNIGKLMNYKNIYFVPMRQDDSENKPNSVVADFFELKTAAESALLGKQIQPILV